MQGWPGGKTDWILLRKMSKSRVNEPTDERLLIRMKDGDQQAFALIYARHAADLVGFTSGKVSSLDEARDLVHDLFVELWEKRDRIHLSNSFRSYLFAAVRYKIIDHFRKNGRQEYYSRALEILQTTLDNSTHDSILYRDFNTLTESEIDKLPPRMREIFRLSRQRHLSVREIAGKLGLSDQTVKNQLSVALKKLRPGIHRLVKNFIFL